MLSRPVPLWLRALPLPPALLELRALQQFLMRWLWAQTLVRQRPIQGYTTAELAAVAKSSQLTGVLVAVAPVAPRATTTTPVVALP